MNNDLGEWGVLRKRIKFSHSLMSWRGLSVWDICSRIPVLYLRFNSSTYINGFMVVNFCGKAGGKT